MDGREDQGPATSDAILQTLAPGSGSPRGEHALLSCLLVALEELVTSTPPSSVLAAALSLMLHIVCSGRTLPDLLRCIRLLSAAPDSDLGVPDVHTLLR
jgi:hypothetical protein